MARTAQTARRRVVDDNAPPDEEDQQEINGHVTEEDKKRFAELEKLPMQAELKHLEKRWTKKGRSYIAEPKDDDDTPEEFINWYEKFALCITRTLDNSNKHVVRTTLHINSPSLKKLMKDVMTYPGISFLTSTITIELDGDVKHCLYHYRQEFVDALEKAQKDAPDGELARHLPLLLDFIQEQFKETIAEVVNFTPQGLTSYEHMWTLFRPGIKIYSRLRGQPRIFKLNSYCYVWGQCPNFRLDVEYIDYDGDDFGTRITQVCIPQYRGTVPVTAMNAYPLARHPNALDISKTLITRGKKWEEIQSQKQAFMEYKGVALDCRLHRYNIDSRVMIDTATFHRIEADDAFSVAALPLSDAQKAKATLMQNDPDVLAITGGNKDIFLVDREPLSDEHRMIATPLVRGFSFTEKMFLEFFVESLKPIEWNTSCFEQLVLPSSQKELVQALVAEHTARHSSGSFDDIVKNKGLGLILVLHGPPGVGKTLTAECVAEFSKRPLYIVSSGDLGTTSGVLDTKLTQILDLASTWKAVLLIDEADVFLERRSLHDMERNSLVSIFLRTLEYYSGILFMTTNRVRTFDDAFKSRIHCPLKYDSLPKASRVKIWKNFLDKLRKNESEGGVIVDVDEAGYDILADSPLNGRQIKNVVRTAKSLASHKGKKLDVQALLQVVEIQMDFEHELDKADSDGDISMVEKEM